MIIVFSGIDGSGKTTCAEAAGRYLLEKGIDHRYIHVVRDSFYNRILHDFIGRFSKESRKSLEAGLRNRKNKLYFPILKTIKKILLTINLLIFNLRFGKYARNTEKNIICDRYFYDDIVQMKYLRLAGERFLLFYEKLIIRPDLLFFLKVPPAKARERKIEYDKDYYSEKCGIYETFYKSIPGIIEATDASLEENNDFVRAKIKESLTINI